MKLPKPSPLACWLLGAAAGLGAGLLNGLLGAAGGILLVVALPYLVPPPRLCPAELPPGTPLGTRYARRDLLATALAVMLPVSAASLCFYWLGGIRPPLDTAALILVPSIGGGLLGAHLLGRLPEAVLRKMFALLLVVSGVRMLLG